MSLEAFILLTLPTATLNISHQSHSGPFELKCVSLIVEGGQDMQGNNPPSHQEIYLVIRVHGHDTFIDPSRPITLSSNNHGRSYVFGTADGGTGSLLLRIPAPHEVMTLEDQNTLHYQTVSHEATRGRLILVDDNTGKVVGELDHRLPIREDPTLGIPGTEAAPVVIEIADDDAQEVFARAIPPEDRDWITNSASLVSRVISGSTKLLLTTVTFATDSFIANSIPHARVSSENGASAPALPWPLTFLTSKNAQKGLSTIHALNVQAATLSSEIVRFINNIIEDTTRDRGKTASASVPVQPVPSHPPSSSTPSEGLSPLYAPSTSPHTLSLTAPATATRYTLSPAALSNLIQATMDSSVRRIVSAGGDNFARAVEHKYGPEAARSAGLVAGTAKNIIVVYIDMRSVGRRAIIKRVGKEYPKAKLGRWTTRARL
ncbi:hypothetical protein J3A83DRAFT_4436221 [Scleroderma citrinum]